MTTLSGDARVWSSSNLRPLIFSYGLPSNLFRVSSSIRRSAQQALWHNTESARTLASNSYRDPSFLTILPEAETKKNMDFDDLRARWHHKVTEMANWFDQSRLKENLLEIDGLAERLTNILMNIIAKYEPGFAEKPICQQIEHLQNLLKKSPLRLLYLIMKNPENADPGVIEALIASDTEEIRQMLRGRSVATASAFGRLNIVDRLLKNGSIDSDFRLLAITASHRKGHPDVIKRLIYDNSLTPTERDRLIAAEKAISSESSTLSSALTPYLPYLYALVFLLFLINVGKVFLK